jgi:hypothetical protein
MVTSTARYCSLVPLVLWPDLDLVIAQVPREFNQPLVVFTEQPAEAKTHINFRRTMSKACCEAHQRTLSRSPGNLRSTTSLDWPLDNA